MLKLGHWSLRLLGFGTVYYYPWEVNLALCDSVVEIVCKGSSIFFRHFCHWWLLKAWAWVATATAVKWPEVVEERKREVHVVISSYSTDGHILGSIYFSLCWQELSRRGRCVLSAANLHTVYDAIGRPNNTLLPKCEVWGAQTIIWT